MPDRVPGSIHSHTVIPIHTRIHTLMTEAAMQGASCSSGAIWGGVSCSRTLAQHATGGVGIRNGDLPITRRPALPTDPQPP